jgi:receptor protein-tyrosine kinase
VSDSSSASTNIVAFRKPARVMGAVLVDVGRLRPEDIEHILWLQLEKRLRFGDAAKELGLLTQADIEFALSLQFDYPYLQRGESRVSEDVIAAYDPFSKQVEALRALRSELMLRWFDDPAHKMLAIVSAARGEGRSYLAANLAVVFSQLGQRTLLIDADLRNPCQHKLFDLDARATGLSAMLSGRAGLDAVQRIPSLARLSVLPAGVLPPNPQELVARPAFAHLLNQLVPHLDVIILDSPAAETADAQTLAVRAGAALLVVRKNTTRMSPAKRVFNSVVQTKATIVGTVFNDF